MTLLYFILLDFVFMRMYIAAVFVRCPNWKQHKCPSAGETMDEQIMVCSYNGMWLCNKMNKLTSSLQQTNSHPPCNKEDESQKHYIEQNKSDIHRVTLSGCSAMKFNSGQNYNIRGIELWIVAFLKAGVINWKVPEGTFWGNGNIWVVVTWVYICQTSSNNKC